MSQTSLVIVFTFVFVRDVLVVAERCGLVCCTWRTDAFRSGGTGCSAVSIKQTRFAVTGMIIYNGLKNSTS